MGEGEKTYEVGAILIVEEQDYLFPLVQGKNIFKRA